MIPYIAGITHTSTPSDSHYNYFIGLIGPHTHILNGFTINSHGLCRPYIFLSTPWSYIMVTFSLVSSHIFFLLSWRSYLLTMPAWLLATLLYWFLLHYFLFLLLVVVRSHIHDICAHLAKLFLLPYR